MVDSPSTVAIRDVCRRFVVLRQQPDQFSNPVVAIDRSNFNEKIPTWKSGMATWRKIEAKPEDTGEKDFANRCGRSFNDDARQR